MSAIFISHSSKDNEWAGRIAAWLKDERQQRLAEHRYDSLFLDFDPEDGIPQGQSWRATLYRKLQVCRAVIVVCSRHYCASQWCLAELGIAIHEGKLVLPVRIDKQQDHSDLPRLLSETQAWVLEAIDPEEGSVAGWGGLERGLEGLSWRERLAWKEGQCPYPGLPAFSRNFAPVFFGRDAAITRVQQKLNGLAERSPAFLLLLGASGYGKSSLVRAGVVPQLDSDGERKWLVLEPFSPGKFPFAALHRVLREPLAAVQENPPPAEVGSDDEAGGLVNQLHWLRSVRQTPVVLVIDQFEELLSQLSGEGEEPSEGEQFLAFLQRLLREQLAGVMVLATMRTDFLDLLQSRWPDLVGVASTEALEPIRPEDFAELITGPAARSGLTLQPGLTERLVSESGGRDALPLLAFTLEKLWQKRQERGAAVAGPNGTWWDLTVEDYDALGGVEGAVKNQADLCWNPETGHGDDAAALRDAFLENLVTVNEEGKATKRPAQLQDLPERSRPIVERMVNQRLLVASAVHTERTVEIAHEALLRTWEPLVKWIEEGKEELLQCLRVKRLGADLTPEAPERQRRQALEQLAALAAAGGSEERAVQKEARETLEHLLIDGSYPLADREDAALVLALIGAEEPLQQLLANGKVPVGLWRRAAESLGLLAQRTTDSDQRHRIKEELEQRWLRSEPLKVRIEVELDSAAVASLTQEVDAYVSQLQAAGRLEGLSEEEIQQGRKDLLEQGKRKLPVNSELAPGWAVHDAHLPLLQGAARGLQLAASADLPLLGSGPGLVVPMLTLKATEEEAGLLIRTEVVEVPVWRLPLPGGEQLELVAIPGGRYEIGSPKEREGQPGEVGRDAYTQVRQRCEDVDVEAERTVQLTEYWMVRHPISQAQWRVVVEEAPEVERGSLKSRPGSYRPEGLWEDHGQPGALPVDSVSWNDAGKWLVLLNRWLKGRWSELGGIGKAPRFALPSESQWEAACRAGSATPFHFGATLDPTWANFEGNSIYGRGRKGSNRRRPVPIGFFGLVNRWGLAELHGQMMEWCGDQWHRYPLAEGWRASGEAREGTDPGLADVPKEREYRLLRGGSWYVNPLVCRAAFRDCDHPGGGYASVGVRPCCLLPPGLVLGP